MYAIKTRIEELRINESLHSSDVSAIGELVTNSGVFRSEEIMIAMELAEDRLSGKDSSYNFLCLRDIDGNLYGYSCYGEIPLTDKRFDLYWIVIDNSLRGSGYASQLLQETEKQIISMEGKQLYAETSGTEAYAPARSFYLKNGFKEVASFPDFYRDGDAKIVYCKNL